MKTLKNSGVVILTATALFVGAFVSHNAWAANGCGSFLDRIAEAFAVRRETRQLRDATSAQRNLSNRLRNNYLTKRDALGNVPPPEAARDVDSAAIAYRTALMNEIAEIISIAETYRYRVTLREPVFRAAANIILDRAREALDSGGVAYERVRVSRPVPSPIFGETMVARTVLRILRTRDSGLNLFATGMFDKLGCTIEIDPYSLIALKPGVQTFFYEKSLNLPMRILPRLRPETFTAHEARHAYYEWLRNSGSATGFDGAIVEIMGRLLIMSRPWLLEEVPFDAYSLGTLAGEFKRATSLNDKSALITDIHHIAAAGESYAARTALALAGPIETLNRLIATFPNPNEASKMYKMFDVVNDTFCLILYADSPARSDVIIPILFSKAVLSSGQPALTVTIQAGEYSIRLELIEPEQIWLYDHLLEIARTNAFLLSNEYRELIQIVRNNLSRISRNALDLQPRFQHVRLITDTLLHQSTPPAPSALEALGNSLFEFRK